MLTVEQTSCGAEDDGALGRVGNDVLDVEQRGRFAPERSGLGRLSEGLDIEYGHQLVGQRVDVVLGFGDASALEGTEAS